MATTTDISTRPRSSSPGALLRLVLCIGQGLFYVGTGVWPLLSIDTFQMVTGPKTDLWLVNTVGVLVTVLGVVLLAAAWRREFPPEVPLLAIGAATALTGIDVVYTARGVILPVYLLDAAAESVLILLWLVALTLPHRSRSDASWPASA